MSDLISRRWLLDLYGDYIGDNGDPKYHVPLEVVRQNIIDAPSADAEIKCIAQIKVDTDEIVERIKEEYDIVYEWIPCSERLPIARESVILSTKEWTGEGCYWETTEHHVIWKGYRWNATYWDAEVLAWMPLPPSYRGK